MRRLPPQNIEENLAGLIDLVPALCEDLLSSIDQPLKVICVALLFPSLLLQEWPLDSTKCGLGCVRVGGTLARVLVTPNTAAVRIARHTERQPFQRYACFRRQLLTHALPRAYPHP